MKNTKNLAAVALGKKSAEKRKKKIGELAFNDHMKKIAQLPRNGSTKRAFFLD